MIAKASAPDSRLFWLTNSLWLLVGRGGSQALGFLLTIVVARSLGDVGLGQFTVVLTVVFIGNVFSTFGLDTLLIRSVARDPKSAPISAVIVIQLLLSLLFIGGVWGLAPADTLGWGMKIYSLALVPLAATTLFNAILRAQERMSVYTSLQLFSAGCRLAVIVGLLYIGAGFLTLIWGLLICQVLEAIATGWVTLHNQLSPINFQHPTFTPLLTTFKAGLVLAGLAVFAIVYQRAAVLLLAWFGDAALTGQFSAAMRLVDIPRMIPYALAGALFPAMARANYQLSIGNWQLTINRSTNRWFALLGVGAIGLAAVCWPLANWLTQLIFGDEYGPAASTLPILAWSLVPFVAVLYGSFVLVAINREIKVMLAHGTALILAVVIGYFGFTEWQLPGLAAALVATEMIHAIILLSLVRRSLHATS